MSRQQERGIVLVAVLFAVAIMSVLVVAVAALSRASIASQGLEQRRLATHFALRSGLEIGKALILSAPAAQRAFLDASPVTVDIGSGIRADIAVRDAAGLADLNATDLAVIENLLGKSLTPAQAADIAGRIGGWRALAGEQVKAQAVPAPVPQSGAEKTPEAASSPLVVLSPAQVQALVNPDVAEPFAAYFTVFNPAGPVNPLAAPDEVLLAIPGFTPADLSAVRSARRSRAEPAGQDLAPMLERLGAFLAIREPTVFVIGVQLREGPGVIVRSRAEAVVQLAPDGPMPFRTLAVSGL